MHTRTSTPYAPRTNVPTRAAASPSCRKPVPDSYSSLTDPHLEKYFRRKLLSSSSAPAVTSTTSSSLVRRSWSRLDSSATSSFDSTKGRRKEKGVSYKVSVKTGSAKDAGTATPVYITLIGSSCKWPKKRLATRGEEELVAGSLRTFHISGPPLGEVCQVVIEHNSVKREHAWFLEYLTIADLNSGRRWRCNCHQWLSLHHTDCQLSRALLPKPVLKGADSSDCLPKPPQEYSFEVVTGDTRGAGTDANVFVTLNGSSGSTAKLHLKDQGGFERGSTRVFTVTSPVSVGEPISLHIEHDNSGFAPAWFLDHVAVHMAETTTFFPCGLWLALDVGDGKIARVLHPVLERPTTAQGSLYKITVETGDVRGAGTDANVYITLHGSEGVMTDRLLESHPENFERGRTDVFTVRSQDLGDIECLSVRHDNTGPSPAWYIERVLVAEDKVCGRSYVFLCQKWLGRGFEGDCQANFYPVPRVKGHTPAKMGSAPKTWNYTVTMTTGDHLGAGTGADVYLILHGRKESSDQLWLSGAAEGAFCPGALDQFTLQSVVHPVLSVSVGHNGRGSNPGWFLEKVELKCLLHGVVQVFPCSKWLAGEVGGGRTEQRLAEQMPERTQKLEYCLSFTTANDRDAGTNASVCVTLLGSKESSGRVHLPREEELFERGMTDEFKFSFPILGEVEQIAIVHDGSGEHPDWLLTEVTVVCTATGQQWVFACNQWLRADQEVTLPCTQTTPPTHSLDKYISHNESAHRCPEEVSCENEGGGYDGEIFEEDGRSAEEEYGGSFCSSDSGGSTSDTEEEEEEKASESSVHSHDGSPKEEPSSVGSVMQGYELTIFTTDKKNSGTTNDLHVQLVGSKATSKLFTIRNSLGKGTRTAGMLQQGRVDVLHVATQSLGTISSVRVAHVPPKRNQGVPAEDLRWHLWKIGVKDMVTQARWLFPCSLWLSVGVLTVLKVAQQQCSQ